MARIRQSCRLRLSWALLCILTVHLFSIPDALAQSADAEAQRQLGLSYLRDRQLGNALDAYQRALDLEPENEILYLEKTDIFLSAGLPEDAEDALAEAVERFPDSTSPAYNLLYHDLAEMWASTGRLGKASTAMELASRVNGPVAPRLIFKRIGDFNTDLLRLDTALTAYQTALSMDPANIVTRVALGNLQLRRNSLDEALAEFTTVLSTDAGNVSASHGIAEIYRRRGEFAEALGAADRVLDLIPRHRGALYIRGAALVRLGRREEGQRTLETYRRLQANARTEDERLRDINTYRTGGMDHVLRGRYQEAIELFEAGIRSYPDAAELHLNLGRVQGEAGRHEDAIETFLAMLERGIGDSAVAHQNLAREYLLVGDIEASDRHRDLYEAALGAEPE